MFDFLIRKAK